MVPLLRSEPLAQKEFVSKLRGRMVLESRSQSPPHAEWLLIWSGSFEARSKKTTRVGETTMDSSATMPDVSFMRVNCQPGEGAATARGARSARRENAEGFMLVRGWVLR